MSRCFLLTLLLLVACQPQDPSTAVKKVIVLGFDGMDYGLTQDLIDAGQLPNLAALAQQGLGAPLATSVPPLSPVAWSEFITGMDAGGHGIFDFIHRDPATMQPYLSTSTVEPVAAGWLPEAISVGGCRWPLKAPVVSNLRQGEPFWNRLEAAGIRTHIIRMPANYPPSGSAFRELSGMGTPDLLGTYGTFSFYSTDLFVTRKSVDGGELYPVEIINNQVDTRLFGPANPFSETTTSIPFRVIMTPESATATLSIGGREYPLRPGQWSPWVAVKFDLDCMPFMSVSGMVRFYLRSLRPELELYVSPVNIDPLSPAVSISSPSDFAGDLARATGRFYTQGMMEDTKAFAAGVLTRKEFLQQSALAAREIEDQYFALLSDWQGDLDGGLLFYYFGNLDQVSHMMFRHHIDPVQDGEPMDHELADVVPQVYRNADRIIGDTLSRLEPEDLLIVMSDHGFAPWRRAFHLNAWLLEAGYLVLKAPAAETGSGPFANVDWSRTRAYGLGFNGLYVNQQGRENAGIVPASEAAGLLAEIASRLARTIDPAIGKPAVTRTYITRQYFNDRENLATGPDLIVGYAKGWRNHSDSAIGVLSARVFSDNDGEWSGDHAMDHTLVPGILFSSSPLIRPPASLRDLSGSILTEFGLP